MTAPSTPAEQRLRALCRALAVLMCLGTAVELWLVDHTGGFVQWIPFILCGVVCLSVTMITLRPAPPLMFMHRLLMIVVIIASGYGVYAHISHNMVFAREIRPSAPARDIWLAGIRGGNPLLAAGVFAIVGTLGLAGTPDNRDRFG